VPLRTSAEPCAAATIVPDTPFDGIEGAQDYVRLLLEALAEARDDIREDVVATGALAGAERRLDALRLVEYKLAQLHTHLHASSRILNDLRTLRRLLLAERGESE
jgi:hypothetical protein